MSEVWNDVYKKKRQRSKLRRQMYNARSSECRIQRNEERDFVDVIGRYLSDLCE